MRPDPLRATTLLVLSLALPLTLAPAQAQDEAGATAAEPKTDATNGLPDFLLPVPAGKVVLGMELETLWELCQAVSIAPQTHITNFRNTATELGVGEAEVDRVFLAKRMVTNGEYSAFVEATGHRFPYHWWRFGAHEDYESRLKEINEIFKDGGPGAPIDYWEQYWQTKSLPWALKDREGKDISDLPVGWITHTDAQAYAAWVGMRLPTEPEWTRAARGDTEAMFVWGASGNKPDEFVRENDQTLKDLGVYNPQVRPAGEGGPMAVGPYGHRDMVGQLWEWTLTREQPLAGRENFEQEWNNVRRHGVLREIKPPLIGDNKFVAKGGSYAGQEEPIALHIDSRVSLDSSSFFERVGFRLAKSPIPARDLVLSSLNATFRRDLLQHGQDLVIDEQCGLERYHLDQGKITAYEGVGFVPVNFLTKDTKLSLSRWTSTIVERSNPALVGVLVLTTPLANPELPAGIYSVCYRPTGLDPSLVAAIASGQRELNTGREVVAKDGPQWREVLKKFGITEEEVKPKGAVKDIDFVRFGGPTGLKVPVSEKDHFVLRNNEGEWVASIPVPGKVKRDAGYRGPTIEVDTAEKGNRVKFHFGVEMAEGDSRNRHLFTLPIELATPADGANQRWRISGNDPD